MSTVHFLCGFMGFGKSTVARRLAAQYNAVVLNDDEFICELFGRDLPQNEFDAAHAKVSRFTWKLGERIAGAGGNVIFDCGFWSRASRADAVERMGHFCENIQFHQIECDMETAKQRVLNRSRNDKSALKIDEATFDALAHRYEPIGSDENLNVIYYNNNLPLF